MKTSTDRRDLMWIFLIVIANYVNSGLSSHVCSLPADLTQCEEVDFNWHYDPVAKECRDSTYTHCGAAGNSYLSEEECYKYCAEKLLELHPPQNVTLGLIQEAALFLYWFPPHIYDLVDPNMTSGNQSTDMGNTTLNVTNGTNTDASTVGNEPSNSKNISSVNKQNATVSTTKKPDVQTPFNMTGPQKPQSNLSIFDFIGKTRVPFHLAKLLHYKISYKPGYDEDWTNITVPANQTEANLTGLRPDTQYLLYVYAVYITNTSLPSPAHSFKTSKDSTVAENCYCDRFGTLGGPRPCNLSLYMTPNCPCKTGYTGLFCEICQHRYYRTAVGMPCHQCPCSPDHSSGICHFVERYLHCTQCKEGYAGNLCHRCANGYFRNFSGSPTTCEKCWGCSNIEPGLICDPFSGSCLQCENSTGQFCEKCVDGYIGDKLHDIPCLHATDACRLPSDPGPGKEALVRYWYNHAEETCQSFTYGGKRGNSNNFITLASCEKACHGSVKNLSIASTYKPPSPGIIAGVVVAVILVLSGTIGFIVYHRMKPYHPSRPFWTIELKEDHEGVNFSAVPEDEIERQRQEHEIDDARRAKSSQPYSRLPEET